MNKLISIFISELLLLYILLFYYMLYVFDIILKIKFVILQNTNY